MNFGTKGCMYNCGDECTGECIKVETKTKKMSKRNMSEEFGKIINVLSDNRTRCKKWCGMLWCDENDCINISRGFADETNKKYYTQQNEDEK